MIIIRQPPNQKSLPLPNQFPTVQQTIKKKKTKYSYFPEDYNGETLEGVTELYDTTVKEHVFDGPCCPYKNWMSMAFHFIFQDEIYVLEKKFRLLRWVLQSRMYVWPFFNIALCVCMCVYVCVCVCVYI